MPLPRDNDRASRWTSASTPIPTGRSPSKRGQAFAIFGIAVVVAPVVGPTLGGWLSDNLSWRWCFLINGPVGLFTFALVSFLVQELKSAIEERRRMKRQGIRMAVVGFLLVATFLG